MGLYLQKCRHGTFMLLHRDLISECMKVYGEWAEKEVLLFAKLLKPGDTVIEVGANIGTHSVPLSRIIGAQGKILCIEPQQYIFQVLNANLAMNSVLNATTLSCIVSDDESTMRLSRNTYSEGGNAGAYEVIESVEPLDWFVPVRTIDSLVEQFQLNQVAMLKVDVEGMESQVLSGARETIERDRPILFFESNPSSDGKLLPEARQTMEWLGTFGYKFTPYCNPGYNPENFRNNTNNYLGEQGDFNFVGIVES